MGWRWARQHGAWAMSSANFRSTRGVRRPPVNRTEPLAIRPALHYLSLSELAPIWRSGGFLLCETLHVRSATPYR